MVRDIYMINLQIPIIESKGRPNDNHNNNKNKICIFSYGENRLGSQGRSKHPSLKCKKQ